MNDLVIKAINSNSLTMSNLNFDRLRRTAGISSGEAAFKALDRGRITIPNQELLNQYLFSYGCMVSRQWHKIMPEVSNLMTGVEQAPLHIYDYGCGQGLGTMLFKEKIAGINNVIHQVTLVEPSKVALHRAKAIVNCILPRAVVNVHNQTLDDYVLNDTGLNDAEIKVHIFSNVLDIPSFNQLVLVDKLLEKKGIHYLVAVSNDRDCVGGTPRLKKLFEYLCSYQFQSLKNARVEHAMMDRFVDYKGYKSIYFILKIEV